ncbi:hypothetical protein COOONC_05524 [Cooperia oncophora]
MLSHFLGFRDVFWRTPSEDRILAIRWDLFDIAPLQSNRKSFLPNSYQKVISVLWTNLCEVKCVERAPGELTPMLEITWLPALGKGTAPSEEEITLRFIAQNYENRTWKAVTVEFESVDKAQQAREHMVDVVRALNSPAFQVKTREENVGFERGSTE